MRNRGFVLASVTLLITTVLWAWGRLWLGMTDGLWPWRGPAQLTALWMVTLTALCFLVGARVHSLERLFGGLDRAVALHRWLGISTFAITALHIALLIPTRLNNPGEVFNPLLSGSPFAIDIWISYAMVPLGAAVFARALPYRAWLRLHRVMAGLFLLACGHSLTVAETVQRFEPLRFWMVFLVLAGLACFAWRLLFFARLGPRYPHRVTRVEPRGGGATDLWLRPEAKRVSFQPGAFAYLAHRGELHPFSMSSSPIERELRFSIRGIGPWTRSLPAPGTQVDVLGPFGGFSPHAFQAHKRIVMIGVGIGITPFLSMLRFEEVSDDFRRFWLYYGVRNEADAPYHAELSELAERANALVDYRLWASARAGRLSAAAIAADVAPFDDYSVMLCGPGRFLRDMRSQFMALGVPRSRIIDEEFDWR